MPTEPSPIQVEFAPEFKRNLRALAKKYRHIRSDVQPVIVQIEAGNFVGDRIPGTAYVVFKVRVQNSDIPKGKRSGYRLIYQVKTPTLALLVTIYSKLDQADISPEQIRRILREFDSTIGGRS
jgi:mRNA-degrading endonuclease RelE of RelBE toxin-antitoxin system